MARRSVAITHAVGAERVDHLLDHVRARTSGSSPCTLTMISHVRSRATSAMRSVPVGESALRHPRDAAEAFHRGRNPLVVGGDDDRVDAAGLGRAAIDVLDHRPAGHVCEWLSGETCRVIPGGNDGDDARCRCRP